MLLSIYPHIDMTMLLLQVDIFEYDYPITFCMEKYFSVILLILAMETSMKSQYPSENIKNGKTKSKREQRKEEMTRI